MEAAREAARRAIELMLDGWVEISMSLPDSPERQAINEKMAALEERLLHWDDPR